jgi:VanZ family protein
MRPLRWLPAVVVMIVIFGFSSIPASEMPAFGFWDLLVKKGAHVIGYAFLASALWYGLGFQKQRWWLAVIIAVAYALTDEFHQSFVPGRHPSLVDALVIDGTGAVLGLLLSRLALTIKK